MTGIAGGDASLGVPSKKMQLGSVVVEKDHEVEIKIWSCCDGTDMLCNVNAY